MKFDIRLYGILSVVPLVTLFLLLFYPEDSEAGNALMLLIGIPLTFYVIVVFPFFLFLFIRAIIIFRFNDAEHTKNHEDNPAQNEPTKREYTDDKQAKEKMKTYFPPNAPTFQIEKEKLQWILQKYYSYRVKLYTIADQLNSGELSLTMDELQIELNKMPLYATFSPVDTSFGPTAISASKRSAIITIPILVLLYFFFMNIQENSSARIFFTSLM